jgi:hypothetical protein
LFLNCYWLLCKILFLMGLGTWKRTSMPSWPIWQGQFMECRKRQELKKQTTRNQSGNVNKKYKS